ncbi:MAG: hypothetical protein NTY09_07870 [bacterium]|nr:hypothetical protein [bacterium]
MKKVIILILLSFIFISCSKHGPTETVITEPDRGSNAFLVEAIVFGSATGVHYDADIAEIIQGPATIPASALVGHLWLDDTNGNGWAIAVALKEEDGIDQHSISYKFLYDDANGQAGVIQREFTVQNQAGNDDLKGIIGLPRVAACYINQVDEVPEPDVPIPYVEISIVFQYKATQNDLWHLGLARIKFDLDDNDNIFEYDNNWANVEPDEEQTIIFTLPQFPWVMQTSGSDGAIQPDVAYDPRNWDAGGGVGKGDLYIVFSWNSINLPGQRVYLLHYRRDGGVGFYNLNISYLTAPFLIQRWHKEDDPNEICLGYQPRIDIGPWKLLTEYGASWRVTIAYTGEDTTLFPHFAFLTSINPLISADVRLEVLFPQINSEHNIIGLSPTLDITIPDSDFCAVTWTQIPTGFSKDVNIGYVDTFLNVTTFKNEILCGTQWQFSSPSVTCIPDPYEPTQNLAYVSYLKTLNPSSFYWKPTGVIITAIPGPPISVDFGVETDVDQAIIGDGGFDLISEYTSWHGMSCSAALNLGSYWVLWSSPSDDNDDKSLTEVFGAFGRPNY